MSFQFSEAAKLYAEKIDLVQAMEEEFRKGINEFAAAVEETVRDRVKGQDLNLIFCSQQTTVYTYWWLASDEERKKDDHIQIWFATRQPEIITSRKLVVKVGSNKATPEVAAALKTAWKDQLIESFARASSKPNDAWWMFEAVIDFDCQEPIEEVANQVMSLFATIRSRAASAQDLAKGQD